MEQKATALVLALCCFLLLGRVNGQTGLSESDKQTVLTAHNQFRGMVSPTASNMERMVNYSVYSHYIRVAMQLACVQAMYNY